MAVATTAWRLSSATKLSAGSDDAEEEESSPALSLCTACSDVSCPSPNAMAAVRVQDQGVSSIEPSAAAAHTASSRRARGSRCSSIPDAPHWLCGIGEVLRCWDQRTKAAHPTEAVPEDAASQRRSAIVE